MTRQRRTHARIPDNSGGNVDDDATADPPRSIFGRKLGQRRKRHGLGHPVEGVERQVAREPAQA